MHTNVFIFTELHPLIFSYVYWNWLLVLNGIVLSLYQDIGWNNYVFLGL